MDTQAREGGKTTSRDTDVSCILHLLNKFVGNRSLHQHIGARYTGPRP